MDERGRLYLRGREREEINKAGMKVYPGDVDAVVERFPSTLDVCTFALSDALLGEDVGIAVVLSGASDETLLALRAWAASTWRRTSSPSAGTCWTRSPAPRAGRSTAPTSRSTARG